MSKYLLKNLAICFAHFSFKKTKGFIIYFVVKNKNEVDFMLRMIELKKLLLLAIQIGIRIKRICFLRFLTNKTKCFVLCSL
jgi:hypothetical protein